MVMPLVHISVRILTIVTVPPFGLASITELLKVLLSLLDPSSKQTSDGILIPALSTINCAFASHGLTISRFPVLRQLIADAGCKYLFQLARSDNPFVLSLALRTIATIFETMRPYLKLQQELLISFLIDKLTPPPGSTTGPQNVRLGIPNSHKGRGAGSTTSTSDTAEKEKDLESDADSQAASRTGKAGITPAKGETRELLLETLGHLSRYPEFMVDVWINYDCDIDCEDLFERFVSFLAKASLPKLF